MRLVLSTTSSQTVCFYAKRTVILIWTFFCNCQCALELFIFARTVCIGQKCSYMPEPFIFGIIVYILQNCTCWKCSYSTRSAPTGQDSLSDYQKPRGRYVFTEDILYLPYRTNTENIVFMWCLHQSFTPALHPDVPPPA